MMPTQERQAIPDATKITKNVPGVMVDNDRVRVLSAHIPVGETAPMHSHPEHVVVVLNGGTVKLTYPSGKAETLELESGKAIFMEAQSHEVANLSDKDIDMVVVELK